MEVDSHTACIITNKNDERKGFDLLRLSEYPTVTSDCQLKDNDSESFVKQMQQSVTIGCAVMFFFFKYLL